MKRNLKRLLNRLRLLISMYRFYDLYERELEKHLLGSMDFPYYLALACVLIEKICKEDFKDIKTRYIT